MTTATSKTKARLTELTELEKHIQIIDNGLATFVDVGRALAAIRDKTLYRFSHDSFEAFCKERWGFTRRRADQLIVAANVRTIVLTFYPDYQAPTNEAQARELAKLDPDEQADAWVEATESVPEGEVTAAIVQEVVERRLAAVRGEEAEPPTEPEEPPVTLDGLGQVVEDETLANEVFGRVDELKGLQRDIQSIRKQVKELAPQPIGAFIRLQQIDIDLKNVWAALKFSLPYAVVSDSEHGWLPKDHYDRLPQEQK